MEDFKNWMKQLMESQENDLSSDTHQVQSHCIGITVYCNIVLSFKYSGTKHFIFLQ